MVSTALDGGASRTRSDLIGATSVITVQWSTDQNGFYYLRQFFRQSAAEGAIYFWCQLILDDSPPDNYLCKFVPASFSLSGVSGNLRVVAAQLEVTPNPERNDDVVFLQNYMLTQPGLNWLRDSSFETDSTGDGVSDSWLPVMNGSHGTDTWSLVNNEYNGSIAGVPDDNGDKSQKIIANPLGTGVTDWAGVIQDVYDINGILKGKTICFSAVGSRLQGACTGTIRIDCFDNTNTYLGVQGVTKYSSPPLNSWVLMSTSCTVPANTYYLRCYLWVEAGDSASDSWTFDQAQLELGGSRTTYRMTPA